MLVDLVVLVLPLGTAAIAGVLGDGDLTVAAGFFTVLALHQLGMTWGATPVLLNASASIAKGRILFIVLWVEVLGHMAAFKDGFRGVACLG